MAKKNAKTVADDVLTKVSVSTNVTADEPVKESKIQETTDSVTEPVISEPVVYKTATATVLSYDKFKKKLAVNIDGYGIMLDNIQDYNGTDTYIVKYTGTIGEADCRIISDVC